MENANARVDSVKSIIIVCPSIVKVIMYGVITLTHVYLNALQISIGMDLLVPVMRDT